MEPTVHSQKKYTLTIIDPHKYRQAASAHLGIAMARLFNRSSADDEPFLVDVPFNGRLNGVLDTGSFAEILIDANSSTITHAVAVFRDYQQHPLPTVKVYFLLDLSDASTIRIAPGSHPVTSLNYPLETKGIGQFYL